jgi:hypothetical protein
MDSVKQQKWDGERVMLRSRFVNGDITKATRAELETYLVVLANTGNANKIVGWDETEVVSDVVRHMLQVRIAEELQSGFWGKYRERGDSCSRCSRCTVSLKQAQSSERWKIREPGCSLQPFGIPLASLSDYSR